MLRKPCEIHGFLRLMLRKPCKIRGFLRLMLRKPCKIRGFLRLMLRKPYKIRGFRRLVLRKPCEIRGFLRLMLRKLCKIRGFLRPMLRKPCHPNSWKTVRCQIPVNLPLRLFIRIALLGPLVGGGCMGEPRRSSQAVTRTFVDRHGVPGPSGCFLNVLLSTGTMFQVRLGGRDM